MKASDIVQAINAAQAGKDNRHRSGWYGTHPLPPPIPAEVKEEARRMYAQGHTQTFIAKVLDISQQSVSRIVRNQQQ